MENYVPLLIAVFALILLCYQSTYTKEMFHPEPYPIYDAGKIPYDQYVRKHIYSNNLDVPSLFKYHKYPFYGYSLYGLDDNYYGERYNYMPYNIRQFWQQQVQYRHTSGHNKNSPDYTGLPSFYFRRAYHWPDKVKDLAIKE